MRSRTSLAPGCFALLLVITSYHLFSQTIGGTGGPSPPPAGTGTTSGSVNISVMPSRDLPIGKKVTLTAAVTGIANPHYTWAARCYHDTLQNEAQRQLGDGGVPCDDTGPEVPNFDVDTVNDLSTVPGTQRYTVSVNPPNGPKDSVDIEFHAPNVAEITISEPFEPQPYDPNDPEQNPFEGGSIYIPIPPNRLQVAQSFDVLLKWNGQELGQCASVCFRERIKLKITATQKKLITLLEPFKIDIDFLPTNCPKAVFGGPDPLRPFSWPVRPYMT